MKGIINSAGESLESAVAKDDLVEIVGELTDHTIEALFEIGEALPIVSLFAKGIKTTLAIRDAFFMEKVIAFLQNLGKIDPHKRRKMIDRINEDLKYRQKFGKFSLVALERFDDELKAKYLGVAAGYLAREEISYEFFQRFAHCVDTLTVVDIQAMTGSTFFNFAKNTFHAYESLGLIHQVLRIRDQSEMKLAFKEDSNIIKINHRVFTDWGEATKSIILQLPVARKV